MDTPNEVSTWTKGAVWVMGLGIPILVSGLFAYSNLIVSNFEQQLESYNTRLSVIEQIVTVNTTALANVTTRCTEHQKTSEKLLDSVEQKADNNAKQIHQLATDPRSRPGAFTALDGKEHEKRIDKLEISAETVVHLNRRIDRYERRLSKLEDRDVFSATHNKQRID